MFHHYAVGLPHPSPSILFRLVPAYLCQRLRLVVTFHVLTYSSAARAWCRTVSQEDKQHDDDDDIGCTLVVCIYRDKTKVMMIMMTLEMMGGEWSKTNVWRRWVGGQEAGSSVIRKWKEVIALFFLFLFLLLLPLLWGQRRRCSPCIIVWYL